MASLLCKTKTENVFATESTESTEKSRLTLNNAAVRFNPYAIRKKTVFLSLTYGVQRKAYRYVLSFSSVVSVDSVAKDSVIAWSLRDDGYFRQRRLLP
ncbi:hypothetical protein [Oceanisphaera sp.]|uniref:hypothetical protein n=1 Tax=Oceanisphaera sp. TaxID=1929979 RepID=UPI003A917280